MFLHGFSYQVYVNHVHIAHSGLPIFYNGNITKRTLDT
jgi:hypothetical protein